MRCASGWRGRSECISHGCATLCDEHAVTASCSAEWDYPPHEAVVRRATAIGAELIIAECHKGARTRPCWSTSPTGNCCAPARSGVA
jgi:hypothetical protein